MMALSGRKSFGRISRLILSKPKMNDRPMSTFTSRWPANRISVSAIRLMSVHTATVPACRSLGCTSTIQLGWQLTLYQHLLLDRCLTACLPLLLPLYPITQYTWIIPLILSHTRHFRFAWAAGSLIDRDRAW